VVAKATVAVAVVAVAGGCAPTFKGVSTRDRDRDHLQGDPFTAVFGARRGSAADAPLPRLRAVIERVHSITGEDARVLAETDWLPTERANRLRDRARREWPGAWQEGEARVTALVRGDADCAQLRRAVQDAMVAALLADELEPSEHRALLVPWRALVE
jgi:hypothetical protein